MNRKEDIGSVYFKILSLEEICPAQMAAHEMQC